MAEEGRVTKSFGSRIIIPDSIMTKEATQQFHSSGQEKKTFTGLRAKAGSNLRKGLVKQAGMSAETMRAREKYYWDPTVTPTLIGIPYNIQESKADFDRLQKWMNFYYSTHYLFPALIDIYARFPLIGFEHSCKDTEVKDFFDDVFIEDLDYTNFLIDLNCEYWKTGEAWAIADWSDTLGCWVDDQLIAPVNMEVEVFPLNKIRRFYFDPPKYLRNIVETRDPLGEYQILEKNMPELITAIRLGDRVLINDPSLTQLKYGGSRWTARGEPIMMRGLRQLMIEEKLNRAQNAICDRLISPLILALLGKEGMEPDGQPWIPSQPDIDEMQRALEDAMDSDYRLMVSHFGLSIENVLGYEAMPKLKQDYDDIEEKICLIFGINPEILKGGGNRPYASTALSADFLSQRLKANQQMIKRFVIEKRYKEVSRAQGFWDYEIKGGRAIPITEYVLKYDEEGNEKVIERKKPLIPEIHLQTMNLRDEAQQRDFLRSLREMGVPIANQTMMIGIDFDLDDEVNKISDEIIKKEKSKDYLRQQLEATFKEEGLPVDKVYISKLVDQAIPSGAGLTTPDSFTDVDRVMGPDMMEGDFGEPMPKTRPDISDEMKGKELPEQLIDETEVTPPELPEIEMGEAPASKEEEITKTFEKRAEDWDIDEEREVTPEEYLGSKIAKDKNRVKDSILRSIANNMEVIKIIDKEELDKKNNESEEKEEKGE